MTILSRAERESCLQRFEAGSALLQAAWNSVPPEARQWRPAADKWSAHEVVVHCADSEAYAHTRIRLLLAEAEPLIVGYDENVWARAFDYHAHDPELALRTVEAVRASTGACLRRLPDSAFGKVGTHTERGAYTDADWFRIYAEHLEVHARQIARNLAAWTARG
ncbi:MAG TPA: DinB family protein [Planctomycetota bacterium]|nr:DinB family protein [Planctomycetota bacterium]